MKKTTKALSILLAVLMIVGCFSMAALAADFKLVYDANGGINPPSSQTYLNAGSRKVSTFVPHYEGYSFLGWSEDSAASSPSYLPGDTIYVDRVITLYAVWGCGHPRKFAVGLRDYGADYFVSVQLEDAFLQQFGMSIDQYYAGYSFYFCPDCGSLVALNSSNAQKNVKSLAMFLGGTGFFDGLPLFNTNEKYRLIPTADSDQMDDGDYWFDMNQFCIDNFGMTFSEYKTLALADLSADGAVDFEVMLGENNTYVLFVIKFHRKVAGTYRDYYALNSFDSAQSSFYMPNASYLRRHQEPMSNFAPLPTADSDALSEGDIWLDLDNFMYYLSSYLKYGLDYSEEDVEAAQHAAYYINRSGNVIKAVYGDKTYTYYRNSNDSDADLFLFLHEHGYNPTAGYILLPYEDSPALADGAYWLDMAAFCADWGWDPNDPKLLSYKFYISPDGTTMLASQMNVEVSTFTAATDPTPYHYFNYLRQHVALPDVTIENTGTNITVTAPGGVIDDTMSVVVTENAAINASAIVISDGVTLADVNYTAYNIVLKNAAGETVQPNGTVTVRIPLPAGYDASKVKVYYVDDSGNRVDMNATVENGELVFTTDHFSAYVVVDPTKTDAPTQPETPQQGGCPWCGKTHNGFFQKIIGFFHSIFAKIFGARY